MFWIRRWYWTFCVSAVIGSTTTDRRPTLSWRSVSSRSVCSRSVCGGQLNCFASICLLQKLSAFNSLFKINLLCRGVLHNATAFVRDWYYLNEIDSNLKLSVTLYFLIACNRGVVCATNNEKWWLLKIITRYKRLVFSLFYTWSVLQKIQIFIILIVYYAEANNEFLGPIYASLHLLATQQLLSKKLCSSSKPLATGMRFKN